MPQFPLSARVLVWALICLIACPGLSLPAAFDEDPPSELAAVLARKGKRAIQAGEIAQAYVYYSQASALQPRNRGYRNTAAALQSRGATQIQAASGSAPEASSPALGAAAEVDHALLPPGDLFDSITARELAQHPQLSSPPRLNAAPGRFDFDLNDNRRALFEKIAAQYKLQIIFDNDYPQGGQPIRFRVAGVDYRGALDALQAATGSFVVPLSTRAILVAQDTVAKRNDLEPYVTFTLGVPQVITTQELTEIVQLVRQVTNVEKIGWDTNSNQIVIRDRTSRAALAQALVGELMAYHPEVMIDLELIQVSASDIINYGFNVTNSFPLFYLGGIQHNLATIPASVTNLLTFGAGRTLIGVAAAQVQALFNENSTDSNSIYAARLRSGSGQAGVFHVGEKYPIITSGFVGTTASNVSGSNPTFTAPPAITFENLGLELKATPHVHGADSVSMSIEASYEVLSGQSADGIPVIQSSKISSDFRLRNDEWGVIGGLIGDSKSKTKSGFWGLANIPWIGNLFRQTSVDKETTNLLIGIRPHILYMGPSENVTRPLRAGTDARPFTPL